MRPEFNYFADQFPVPYRVLGKKLKPFCLGHYTLLAHPSIDCAFVSDEALSPTQADLIVGVLICSKTWEQGMQFIDRGKFGEVAKWAEETGPFDLAEKSKLFKEYIETGSEMPKFIEMDDEPRKPSGAHWVQAVKLCLMSSVGYTESQVMNIPLRQAFADYFKYAESQGLVRLMTAEELDEDFEGGTLNGFTEEKGVPSGC